MITKLFSKPELQRVVSTMRKAGYDVERLPGGYECKLDGKLIFKAMTGPSAYLVQYDPQLLTAEES